MPQGLASRHEGGNAEGHGHTHPVADRSDRRVRAHGGKVDVPASLARARRAVL